LIEKQVISFSLICIECFKSFKIKKKTFSSYLFYRHPNQKEWQRKEELYLKIVDYFERDKQWEHAIPICKELSHIYEKRVFDYTKLSTILRKEASLFEKVISSTEDGLRFDPEYFRVGFYGKAFASFLRVFSINAKILSKIIPLNYIFFVSEQRIHIQRAGMGKNSNIHSTIVCRISKCTSIDKVDDV